MKRVLVILNHELTDEQRSGLEDLEVVQIRPGRFAWPRMEAFRREHEILRRIKSEKWDAVICSTDYSVTCEVFDVCQRLGIPFFICAMRRKDGVNLHLGFLRLRPYPKFLVEKLVDAL